MLKVISNPYPLCTQNQQVHVNVMNFGDTLRQLREFRDITQKQLGELVGVSDRVIGYYEANRFPKNADILKSLAEVFDVSIEYLLGYSTKDTTLMKAIREEVLSYVEQQKINLNPEQIEKTVDYVLHDDYLWEKFNHSMAFCINEMLENRPTTEVVEITAEQGIEIIQTRTLLGLFLLKNDNGMWVGIDNRDGDAWTEDFSEKSLCINWLHDVDSKEESVK